LNGIKSALRHSLMQWLMRSTMATLTSVRGLLMLGIGLSTGVLYQATLLLLLRHVVVHPMQYHAY
jgi:hypothetical protein